MKLHAYKVTIEPRLTDELKREEKKFRKDDTMRILFFDEKLFDVNGMYNSQNQHIWVASRAEVNQKRLALK